MRQAVILVGGAGTRLGHLTDDRPKPFVDVGGRPFIDYVILKAKAYGIEEIVFLAGHNAGWIESYYHPEASGMKMVTIVEPKPMGTAGALLGAQQHLDDNFFLLNGDSYFDSNWAALCPLMGSGTAAVLSLREMEDTSRYGSVNINDCMVTAFLEKQSGAPKSGLVNAGVYLVNKSRVLPLVDRAGSLEADILPVLAATGSLKAVVGQGYFIDIGVPSSLQQARFDFPDILHKPAVIFDRDNTLVVDNGYTYKVEDLVWVDGAKDSICALNQLGIQVFVATNQAGQARGYFTEADMRVFHNAMQRDLLAVGGHIDGFYFCPHHPDGIIPELSIDCECRKPGAGMLHNIYESHYVDKISSVMIGDQASDVQAAKTFGIDAYQYSGGSLFSFLRELTIV